MKKLFIALLLAATSVGVGTAQTSPRSGVVRVKLQRSVAAKLSPSCTSETSAPLSVGIAPLDASFKKLGVRTVRRVFPCSKEREAEHAKYGLDQWYEVTFDENVSPADARALFAQTAGVETATMKVPMTLFEGEGRTRVLSSELSGRVLSSELSGYQVTPSGSEPKLLTQNSALPFNDPRLSLQWHYHNDGSMAGSVAGADINLFKAWQVCTGSPKVVVAIIDGGIDYTHEDLADHMWVNTAELNGVDGVDDDGDGYIDDIYGYNFCTNSGLIYPHDHGTHVAGTIGAINGNGKGVCGIAGGDGTKGSGVRLMSCQVFESRSGAASEGDFAAALIYAADKGATIAQCSWGWAEEGYYEEDVLDAVRYFTKSARSDNMVGGLCFFASGNESAQGKFYPAAMDEVVAVASMCYDMTYAYYSCVGDWVDVVAPGGLMDYDTAQGVLSTISGNQYGYKEGTSMATPHVAGIAALVLSKYGSPTLTAENLRQQIITSVNDFYAYNPSVKGLYGNGYVDAYKALQWGDGSAPSAVSQIEATAEQDAVTLTWTIPYASDGNVNNHILYYGTEPITEANLSQCQSVVIDTKFCSTGDTYTYTVEGLASLTDYYFALKAVDRWGNASELSPVVKATTNAGPKMTLNRTSMTIYTENGKDWTTSQFILGNTDEGLLRWSSNLRTTYSSLRAYSTTSGGLMTQPYGGRLTLQPCATGTAAQKIADYEQEDYPKSIANFSSIQAFIGDIDETNSMAQLFTVDASEFPEGFNLTHVYLTGYYGKAPTIEIYEGGSQLGKATLLETFSLASDATVYYYDQALPECLYFAPGESFYIAVHFKDYTTKNYPLGLGLAADGAQTAAQAYISHDWGETWSLLSEALKGTSYEDIASKATWCITAKSKFPDWSQVISLSPSEGQIKQGERQTVKVSHNGTPIPNGTYRAKIQFDTNETEKNTQYVNVTLSVEGYEPDVSYDKVIQFGNLLVGQSKTIDVEVFNKGYGAFAGSATSAGLYSSNISSTSPHFQGPEYLSSGIQARSSQTISLTYAPTEAGSHSGQVVLTDKDGRRLTFYVQGAATDPAKLTVQPEGDIEVGDLEDGSEGKDVTFDIVNEGKYPLQWTCPKFTTTTFDDIASSDVHRFGYNWVSNLYGSDGAEYEGAPTLLDATDVSSSFGDYVYFSDPVDIGFEFPFYGKTYEQVYISSFGMLTFGTYTVGSMYSPLDEDRTSYLQGLGVISAYGFQCEMSPTSRVEYARQDGKFVVNFKDVLVCVYGNDYTPASFHITLSPSGDIEIAFDDYTAANVFQQGCQLWVGIVDPDMEDPLTVTSSAHVTNAYWYDDTSEENNRWRYVNSGTAFRFVAPKPNMISELSPACGIVPPGEKVTVTAKCQATEDMYAGETYTDLVIRSNDLVSPTKLVHFTANITGDLHAVFDLASETVDFGDVFRTSTAQQAATVQNHGRDALYIYKVSLRDGKFSHDFTAPFTVEAGRSKDIILTLPTEVEGSVKDVLTIETSVGTRTVPVKGTVIGVPEASLSYTSVKETMASGTDKDIPLTITNTGNEALTYSIVAGNYTSFTPEFEAGSSTSYTYVSSTDDPLAEREWVDIETNGLGKQYNYTYFLLHDIVAVDLPFEFTYYDKKYKKMYIYDSGFVSFTERNDDAIWPEPPSEFPAGTVYTNLIAPYWGLHTMDLTSTAGVFYYVTEEQAVVSFIEYGNSMNIGIDFQLILRPDGTFTYNYKPAYDSAILFGAFGVAGISNYDGSDGINLPSRYIELNSSINWTPVVQSTLQPGESRTADVKLLGDALAGTYDDVITVTTNVPTNAKIEIPVSLTLTGTAQPNFPADITVENPAEHQDFDADDELISLYGAYWYAPFEVSNSGTAAFTIDAIDVQTTSTTGETDLFTLYYYGKFIDSWTEQETTGWSPYKGSPIEVGRNTVKFALPLWRNDNSFAAWRTPGTYNTRLTFHLSGIDGVRQKVLNVKYVITEQPHMTLSVDEIRVSGVADDYTGTQSFTISNTDGGYPLRYTLRVDPTGLGEEVPEVEAGAALSVKHQAVQRTIPEALLDETLVEGHRIAPSDVGKSEYVYDCPTAEQFDYRRAIYHPALSTSTVAYNYGAATTYGVYKAATGFTAPEGGFNISHIYTAMHPYALDNTDLLIEIYNGDPQLTSDVIGTGTYHIGEVTTELYDNVTFCAELDRPVYVSEGQNFYVVITYPVGQEYPSTLVKKQEALVSGRYLGYVDTYGWFDVAAVFNDSYGSLGYIMSCLETVEGDAWVKLLEPATGEAVSTYTGEVAAGQRAEVKVRLSAADAPKETDNKAVLVLTTNDPYHVVTNFPVYLDKNASPSISAPTQTLYVDEGSRITLAAQVSDSDGDDFTIAVSDPNGAARILSATALDGAEADIVLADDAQSVSVKGAAAGVRIEVQIDAPQDAAGTYTLTLRATDTVGHTSSAAVRYVIAHVNQAPVAKKLSKLYVPLGGMSDVIDLDEVFTDDDDELTYEVRVVSDATAQVYRAGNKIAFEGLRIGTTFARLSATDPSGLTTNATLNLEVCDPVGIENVATDSGFRLTPNPVRETLYVHTGTASGACEVQILSTTGSLLLRESFTPSAATPHAVNVSHLVPGTYVLRLATPSGTFTEKFVKQ